MCIAITTLLFLLFRPAGYVRFGVSGVLASKDGKKTPNSPSFRHACCPVCHVFRVKVCFCNRVWCVSFLFWLAVLYRFSLANTSFRYTYTFTYTYTFNQSSTMSTQQQPSLKSITIDEVAKVSLFHARPYATI
jgi:hypothetical protein